jgi:hypothetical protein
MRFMMMIKATKDSEAGAPPGPALIAGMAKLSEEMMKAGVLLASDGLQPSSKGTRIKYSGGKQGHRRSLHRDQGADRRLRDSPGEVEGRSARIGQPLRGRSRQSGVPEFEMEFALCSSRRTAAACSPGYAGRDRPIFYPKPTGELRCDS